MHLGSTEAALWGCGSWESRVCVSQETTGGGKKSANAEFRGKRCFPQKKVVTQAALAKKEGKNMT